MTKGGPEAKRGKGPGRRPVIAHDRRVAGEARRAFTLIEMLISISIFAVVTAFVMANFRVGRQGDELRAASQLVATSIQRAQTAAIAGQTVSWCVGGTNDGKLCPGGTDAECGGGNCQTAVPHGFGVHLSIADPENRKIVVFADLNGDLQYEPGEEMRVDDVSPGPFVVVSSLDPLASNSLDIVFTPPKPTVTYNGVSTGVIATIMLKHPTTGQTRTVTVNAVSGQVSAE